MFIKQVSIFIENTDGKMAEVLDILGKKDIDISALSVADTKDYGILRLIVNNPTSASEILKAEGYIVKLTDVIAVAIEDKPGGLSKPLLALKDKNIEIDYLYAFVSKNKNGAIVVLKTSSPDNFTAICSFTFLTAFSTLFHMYLFLSLSLNSTASKLPVEAPDGTIAFPTVPSCKVTFTCTVGFPLESKTCIAFILLIVFINLTSTL